MDHEKWLEQHDQMMADFNIGMAQLEASQAKTEKVLRWAIRLAVQDARRQRRRNAEFDKRNAEFDKRNAESDKRHAELDETMQKIAIAQLQNEELLKRFLERGGNGNH